MATRGENRSLTRPPSDLPTTRGLTDLTLSATETVEKCPGPHMTGPPDSAAATTGPSAHSAHVQKHTVGASST